MTDAREPELSGDPPEPSAGSGAGASSSAAGPGDHELVRRAQAGEEEAFRLLVERHEARAMRVAANLVGHGEDARDLAQEAFLRVFKSLERFDFRHEFTTWLYRIVTNLGIDFLRRRRPAVRMGSADEEEDQLELPDESAELPSARLERAETAERVRACIDRLAPHFRSVMVLRELEGLSCIEIADIVGATHVTVRWRLHRGRKLFQDEWERMERTARSEALPPSGAAETPEDEAGANAAGPPP